MILGPINLIDCLVFLVFLLPQLIVQVGLFRTVSVALNSLPFLVYELPIQLIGQRYLSSPASKPIFVIESSLFEDLVIRCVRYAFAKFPPSIGRVFFSKWVALPFLRWRMLRHGYLISPVYWKQVNHEIGREPFRGVWVRHNPELPPDFVLYYLHGGGFAMGSSYFYLEFLLAWHHMLLKAGYQNPAIFSLDYTLVPDQTYPKQLNEVLAGYRHVLETAGHASKVCVAGDSAGGCLTLSLLQGLGTKRLLNSARHMNTTLQLPTMAVLISPWCTLLTWLHYPSAVDYLNRETLWEYARQYVGTSQDMICKYPASPGSCLDEKIWKASSPEKGYYVFYGDGEVFAPDIESFISRQTKIGIDITATKIRGGVHAWPVASLFLSSTKERRFYGLKLLVREISMRTKQVENGKTG